MAKENNPIVLKKVKYLVGDIVYLRTDPYQLRRIVVSIQLTPTDYIYTVRHADMLESEHFDIELSSEKDVEYEKETRKNEGGYQE